MNQQRIDEIRQRCEKTTPGPWISPFDASRMGDGNDDCNSIVNIEGETVVGVTYYDGPVLYAIETDADFISHAREDIPFLLDLLSEQEREIEQLKAAQGWVPVTEGLRI